MMHEGKITVELTPEQMEDLIDAATRAAEQDQEDAEILSSKPHIDREIVELVLETRKRLLTLAAWMQHLYQKQLAEKHAQELNFVAQREIAHAGRKVRKGHLYAAK